MIEDGYVPNKYFTGWNRCVDSIPGEGDICLVARYIPSRGVGQWSVAYRISSSWTRQSDECPLDFKPEYWFPIKGLTVVKRRVYAPFDPGADPMKFHDETVMTNVDGIGPMSIAAKELSMRHQVEMERFTMEAKLKRLEERVNVLEWQKEIGG